MSNLAIGSAKFGQKYGISEPNKTLTISEVEQILSVCKANNIEMIDTAKNYGNTEEILGLVGIKNFKIVTKLPPIPENLPSVEDWIKFNIDDSLQKLKSTNIDTLLLHNPEDLLKNNGYKIFETLSSLKSSGILKKIGISVYNYDLAHKLINKFSLDVIQGPCNLMDRRIIKSGFLEILYKRRIEFHARSVFLQGLLLMKKNKVPRYFFKIEPKLKKWIEICDNEEIDRIKNCLDFLVSKTKISKIILGVDSKIQLEDILHSIKNLGNQKSFNWFNSDKDALIDPRNWKL